MLYVDGCWTKKKMDVVISEQIKREKMLVLFMDIYNRASRRRRRRNNIMMALLQMEEQRKKRIMSCLLQMLMPRELTIQRPRRVVRNGGWFMTLSAYSNKRFKQALRVSRDTFSYILRSIRYGLERQTVTEDPISPEERLAIALYRYGRGDYCFTLEQMTGRATSTIREICNEVAQLIIDNLWEKHVKFPSTVEETKQAVNLMEGMWQCTSAFCAVDGTHIPIKSPPGGAEAAKEYHCFKNFHSIILLGIVDAKRRFLWASCGAPGCNHDATVFSVSGLYQSLINDENFPRMWTEINKVMVPPMILGDSAFTHHTWLQKPYSHAVLSEEEKYFNYRLSRGRIIIECAYGAYKGRWRITHRKQECSPSVLARIALACVVLHNICIDMVDDNSGVDDLNVAALHNEWYEFRSNWKEIDQSSRREMQRTLKMVTFEESLTSSKGAVKARDALKDEFWKELTENDN